MSEAPYTKREQDLMNHSVHEKLDRLIEDIKVSREERHAFEKSVEPLFKAVSDNSGNITLLKKAFEESKQSTKFIQEIVTTWKWGKIIIGMVISLLVAIIAIKKILSGSVAEGLSKLKELIF